MSEPAAAETVTPPVDLSPAVPAAPVTIPDPDTVLANCTQLAGHVRIGDDTDTGRVRV